MSSSVTGLVLAAVASACFNLAIVVQASEARSVTRDRTLSLMLLGRLARRRRWLVGLALGALAVVLQTAALLMAPITLVQPADAVGLFVLLGAGAVALHEPIGRRELLAAGTIVLGVTGVALAQVEHRDTHAPAASLAVVLVPLALAAVAPYTLLRRARLPSGVVVLCAGLAFGLGAFALKLIADSLAASAWPALIGWAATAAGCAVVGMNSEMSALQTRGVARVAPLIFVLELVIPVVLGPAVGGDVWPTGTPALALLVAALLATLAGAAALAHSSAIVRVLAAEPAADSGGVPV